MSIILITGANRGLGLSLAKKYLGEGHTVFVSVREDAIADLDPLFKEYPDTLSKIVMDVSSDESVILAQASFAEQASSLDILINNAAVHFDATMAPLEEVDFDTALETININSIGPLRVTKAFLPMLKKGSLKKIINISSEAGSIADCWREKEFDYCMSKAALNMQTKILDNLLKKEGFTVLSIHPGWMRTDMGGKEADIDSSEAADGIYRLAEEEKGDRLYLDYTGQTMNW